MNSFIKLLLILYFLMFTGCKFNLSNDPVKIETAIQKFSHDNLKSSCITCHQNQMPVVKHQLGVNCNSCHTTMSWKPANINHQVVGANCLECHQEQMPSEKHIAGQNCVTCHSTASWSKKEVLHTSLMSDCTSCHLEQKPYQKHGGDQQCSVCHNTSNWKTTTFVHDKNDTNCISCHVAQKPTVEKFPMPDYEVNDGHYNLKDCSSCHKVSTWEFDHSDAQEKDIKFCLPCHYQRGMKAQKPRPGWHATKPQWYVGDGQCYPCHAQKKSWKRVLAKP